jgi:anti-anti-sigma factor
MVNPANPGSDSASIPEHFVTEKPQINAKLQSFFKHSLPSFANASAEEQERLLQETLDHMALLIEQKGNNPFKDLFIQGRLATFQLEFGEYPTYFKGVRHALRPAFRPFLIRHDRSSIMLLEQIIEQLIDAQNAHLIYYLEKQQQDQQKLHQEASQRQLESHLFAVLAERTPDAIAITDIQGVVTYANPSFHQSLLLSSPATGQAMKTFIKNESDFEPVFAAMVKDGSWSGMVDFKRSNGEEFVGHLTVFPIVDDSGNVIAVPGIMRDISKELSQKQEHSRLQQELIETQQMMLRELSTPIIPLTDSILVMPLVGRIDNTRAQQVMENLLEGVVQHAAEVVILDITGVPFMDADIADILLRIARAVSLLGARMMLTGIRAEVAQTLVALDLGLNSIETHATLQTGIRQAIQAYTKETDDPLSFI